jgi:hypothetical protein
MSEEIEPRHLLLGLCKIVDLDLAELVSRSLPNRNEILEECLREIRRVRDVFKQSGVDAKAFRRRLRASYGKDSLGAIEEGPLHRSERAKKVFSTAASLGDLTNFVVFPRHLLCAVLGEEDVKRDSILAGMGIDKELLCLNAKREVFKVPAAVQVPPPGPSFGLN